MAAGQDGGWSSVGPDDDVRVLKPNATMFPAVEGSLALPVDASGHFGPRA
jgi:hypothetical protein